MSRALSSLFIVALFALPAARADAPELAWRRGVSPAAQKTAGDHYTRGMAELTAKRYPGAVKELEAALAAWDHPAIHDGLARALLNLDAKVEAYGHFWAALAYGGEPLDAEHVEQIARLVTLMYGSDLAHVVVRCDVPGTTLVVGGKALAGAATSWEGVVAPAAPALGVRRGSGKVTSLSALKPGTLSTVACEPDGAGGTTLAVKSTRPTTDDDMLALGRARYGFSGAWPPVVRPAPQVAGAAPGPAVKAAPTAADRICAKAHAGELRTVCDELVTTRASRDALQKAAARERDEAVQKLQALTRGGVADKLQ